MIIKCITKKNTTKKLKLKKKITEFFSEVGKISLAKKLVLFWMDGWRKG